MKKIFINHSQIYRCYTMYCGPGQKESYPHKDFADLLSIVRNKLLNFENRGIVEKTEDICVRLADSDDILKAYSSDDALALVENAARDVVELQKEFRDSFKHTLFSLIGDKKCMFGVGILPRGERGLILSFIDDFYVKQGVDACREIA